MSLATGTCTKTKKPAHVYLALGSNQGDRLGHLTHALEGLNSLGKISLQALSPVYESEPAYYSNQGPFANAVLEISTTFDPFELLTGLQRLERKEGRVRTFPNAPRPLDLDILDYERVCLDTEKLILPHPRLLERDFIVTPLLALSPNHLLADGRHITRDHITCGKVTGMLGSISLPNQ